MAIYADFTIDQGATFYAEMEVADSALSNVDLTGYTVHAQLRKSYTSVNAVDFTTDLAIPLEGVVSIGLSPAQTRALKSGRYVFDVFVKSSSGVVTRVVEGQIEVTPAVTVIPIDD